MSFHSEGHNYVSANAQDDPLPFMLPILKTLNQLQLVL